LGLIPDFHFSLCPASTLKAICQDQTFGLLFTF
jgi:hypothetical protein